MTTWKERNFLCKEKYISWPGFSPRSYHKLVIEKPPYTNAKIKVCQKARCPIEEDAQWHVWGYHTWLDVGRLPPIYRPRPDQPFDSNTWRWITVPRKDSMAEPPVPPPSQLDGNTYVKLIEAEGLFIDQRHKRRILTQAKKEIEKCEQLKIRSECRAPPIDSQGNIIPPKQFKRDVVGGLARVSLPQGFQRTSLAEELQTTSSAPSEKMAKTTRYKHLLPGKSPASLCVQLQPVTPPSRACWYCPCPSLEPHYQAAAVKFALKNNSPIYQEVIERYQELVLSGSKIRPCTPVN